MRGNPVLVATAPGSSVKSLSLKPVKNKKKSRNNKKKLKWRQKKNKGRRMIGFSKRSLKTEDGNERQLTTTGPLSCSCSGIPVDVCLVRVVIHEEFNFKDIFY